MNPASAKMDYSSLSGEAFRKTSVSGGELPGLERGQEPKENCTHRSALIRWGKFNLVGAIGIGVQFAALYFLKRWLHFNYLVATGLAVEAAVLHNFLWHERFTWAGSDRIGSDRIWGGRTDRERAAPAWRAPLLRLVRFHAANGVVSILGNLVLMRLLVGLGHVNYLAANAVAIAICSVGNFLVSDGWVFSGRK